MKTRLAIAFWLLAGVAVGAATVQGLHAQSKPPVYSISEITVTNLDGYTKEYGPAAMPTIKAYGGRFIAAGQPASLSGEPQQSRIVMIAWDNMDQLQRWFASREFKAARQVGEKYAKFRVYAVPGWPQQ